MSEEAKLRAEIERLNQALEQSQAELKDFIYIASHDLNAPIRGISNYAQFIVEDYQDLLPEEGQMFLKRIEILSNHLGDMIQDLVNLSRMGQLEHSSEEADFDQIANDLAQESRNGTLAIEGSLGRFRIHPNAARSILEHLIDNGLTFNRSDRRRSPSNGMASYRASLCRTMGLALNPSIKPTSLIPSAHSIPRMRSAKRRGWG